MRGTVRTSNGLAGNLLAGETTLVKAYDDRTGAKVLRHNGPVSGSNKSVDDRSAGKVTWTASDPTWRLLKRLIGKNASGATFGDALNLVDRGAVLQQIVNAVNRGDVTIGTAKDDTGIRLANGDLTPSGFSYFGPWRWYPAASAMGVLTTGIDAPDVDVIPTEPTPDADGIQIGRMVVAPALGQLRLDAAFEFGDGRKNVKTFEIVSDSGIVANDVAHLPSGYPDNATQAVIETADATSIAQRGLQEDVLTDEVLTDALRTQLVADHVAVRKVPRRTISFSVIRDPDPFETPLEERRVPRPFIDYDVGDIVPFRATELVEIRDATGLVTDYVQMKTVDALFRVFTMDITINDDDSEDIALTFVEES